MNLQSFGKALLRTPVHPLSWTGRAPTGDTIFEEGLYLSSPEFWNEYRKKDTLTGKKRAKLDLSLTKYWLRSCTRCTPYATFAGSALVGIEPGPTRLVLGPPGEHRRSVRLDMNYVSQLVHVLSGEQGIREQLRFFANNSLYAVGSTLRYVEYTIHDNVRKYQLTSIERTPYLDALLAAARDGRRLADLCDRLVREEDVSREEADAFVQQLCEAQLLLSELEPCVTGEEPLDGLIGRLEGLTDTPAVTGTLRRIRDLCCQPQNGTDVYAEVNRALPGDAPRNTLQTDLYLSVRERTLDRDVVQRLLEQVSDLLYLSRRNRNGDLEEFKRAFIRKYEDAEIPLAIALDGDLGIGYAGVSDESAGENELLDGIDVAASDTPSFSNDHIQQYVLAKYHDFLRNGRDAIYLDKAELHEFKRHVSGWRFPDNFYLMGSLLARDGALDKDHFRFDLGTFAGPGAANLFGRFTHGDEALCAFTRDILASEEAPHPDVCFAEVVHLPQARVGNVILRPVLRRFEIPYVGRSGAAAQIPVDDLVVSVQGGEVILRSRSLGKRVLPRLTSAHNYAHNSLPVYKFLCDLQQQDMVIPNVWDWGPLSSLPYLPRVVYGDVIVRKARWVIGDFLGDVEALRRKWALPSRVVFAQYDNELLIDFDTAEGVALFQHYMQRHKSLLLEEFLFTEENGVVTDTARRVFTNELILPVRLETGVVQGAVTRPASGVRRKFPPGSEWLYYKVYCGRKTGERFLKEVLLPLVEQGVREAWIDRFFFIRYRDEASHLRVRFRNGDPSLNEALGRRLYPLVEPWIDDGLIDKVAVDTYTRELERYEGAAIEDVERLFYHDSLAVLRLIDLFDGDEGERYRFLFALRGTDALLDDFGLTLPEKGSLLARLQQGFFAEFGGQLALQQRLNERYRSLQKRIFSHLNPALDEENGIREGTATLSTRSRMNAPVIDSITARIGPERCAALAPSLLHMYLNRLFIAQPRRHELLTYHFMEKYYASRLAMASNI
ncbi:MAG TPA: lantibiotic dehydratase [Dinghuibacter sp.]|uniref:lantibiotic dehydratase n=1 Tax=Dinghuibacter sp. TaxID=2024697 RepID=UPI002B994ADB|nr:lantibiotic dehydratase [Dinghuibacter sp.]HTJ11841.1 lantibiotic dehydratase [Dinghuibacter sp.]